jgi:general secretion pathway protein L
MRQFALQSGSLDLRGLVAGAWRWWVRELCAMVPPALAIALGRGKIAFAIDLLENDIVVQRIAGDATKNVLRVARTEAKMTRISSETAGAVDGAAILVRLPRQDVLNRTITLPFAARRELRSILEFELDRHSPIDPTRVYFGYGVKHRDRHRRQLEVELHIVRRETVEEALSLCRSIGFEPTAVGIAGDTAGAEDGGLMPPGKRLTRRRLPQRLPFGLGLGAFVLATALLIAHVVRYEAAMTALATEVAQARDAARETEAVRRRLDQETLKENFLARQKAAPLFSKVLAEVSRVLPDRTWVFEFEMRGSEVRLHGYSPQASSLIGLFDNAPMFSNARFRSPLTRGPGGNADRFDISFDVKEAP